MDTDYNKFMILERRIAQISSMIEITYGFDIIKTKHSTERSNFSKRDLGYNSTELTSAMITGFIELFKRDISEAIAAGRILDSTNFVIRSADKNLAMVLLAEEVSDRYWRLVIITIFPETKEDRFRTGRNQIEFEK